MGKSHCSAGQDMEKARSDLQNFCKSLLANIVIENFYFELELFKPR